MLKNHKNTPRLNGRKQEKVDERNERPVAGKRVRATCKGEEK